MGGGDGHTRRKGLHGAKPARTAEPSRGARLAALCQAGARMQAYPHVPLSTDAHLDARALVHPDGRPRSLCANAQMHVRVRPRAKSLEQEALPWRE
eukprot:2021696-Pleurochrysis_carterae.AAC.2